MLTSWPPSQAQNSRRRGRVEVEAVRAAVGNGEAIGDGLRPLRIDDDDLGGVGDVDEEHSLRRVVDGPASAAGHRHAGEA